MWKLIKRFGCFGLVIAIIISTISICANALIPYPCKATIKQSRGTGFTYAYTKPGTKAPSEKIDEKLVDGTELQLVADGLDSDGELWYKAKYGEDFKNEGYIYHKHVVIEIEYKEDKEFEEWLKKEKFPDSYKDSLRELHTIHPEWKFYADHLDYTFSEVIAAQTKVGVKTVHNSKPDSWKSMEKDAINPATNKLYNWGGYEPASKTVIEYYTDPRNFLNEENIFIFFSHAFNEDLDTKENLMLVLKDTFLDAKVPEEKNKTYADIIMNAAKEAKLSPFVIASTIMQEQGKADAPSISGKYPGYEGYYNYFNIGATDALGAKGGLIFAKAEGSYGRPWNTRQKSITGGALWYVNGYVSKGQDTYYYMDFDVNDKTLANHQYATNIQDALGKTSFLTKAYSKVMENELVFHIPVFKDMPEKTELPKDESNNNNFLKTLQIDGIDFVFEDNGVTEYEFVVKNELQEITVIATAEDKDAVVTGTGKVKLKEGLNTVEITVTATSGEKRVYTIDIFRNKKQKDPPPEPKLQSKEYKIDKNISGVALETDIKTFKKNLTAQNGTIKIIDIEKKEKTKGFIATGDTVEVYNKENKKKLSFKIVVLGDVSSDGRLTAKDLLMGQQHILKIKKLDSVFLTAIDIDKDSSVKSRDLLMGQRHILKIKQIKQ